MINFITMKIGEVGLSLCNLERGNGNPTMRLVDSVADALGLEMKLVVKDLEAT